MTPIVATVAAACVPLLGGASPRADDNLLGWRGWLLQRLSAAIDAVAAQPVVFFSKHGDLTVRAGAGGGKGGAGATRVPSPSPSPQTLNKALLYVRTNEPTSHVVMVHVVDDRASLARLSPPAGACAPADAAGVLAGLPPPPPECADFATNVAIVDTLYPKIRVDSLVVRGSYFSPPVVEYVARRLGMGSNMCFIAMPGASFPHAFAAMRARLVTTGGGQWLRREAAEHMRDVLNRVKTE